MSGEKLGLIQEHLLPRTEGEKEMMNTSESTSAWNW